jgi:uncharacterized protein YoxC
MAKKKSLKDRYDNETEELDENMNELKDKLNRKTYAVGTETRKLTDVEDDISLNNIEGLGQVAFDTSRKHLLEISGKDSQTNMDIKDVITDTLENLKKHVSMNPTFQERVMLEQEYNYLCAQMPQLMHSIKSKVDNILSPDGNSKNFLNIDITKGENEVSVAEVEKLIDKEDLEEFIKEETVRAFISGTKYVYTVPYKEMARKILNDYGEKRNSLYKNSPDLVSDMATEFMTEKEEELFAESVGNVVFADQEDEERILHKESIDFYDESEEKLAEEITLTDDYLIGEAKDSVAYQINNYKEELVSKYDFNEGKFADDDIELFSEARKPFYNITGCHVDELENRRTIPVVINRELIGVYYIENEEFHSATDTAYNISNVTGSGNVQDTYDRDRMRRDGNVMKRKTIMRKVGRIIRRNLDKKFIKKNRKILDTIQSVLKEEEYYKEDMKIRFIPRDYVTPFAINKDNEGLGRSQIHKVRIIAHLWVLLNYSNSMNKFFHEKDKMMIETKTGVSTDISSVAKRALKAVTDIYPLPSQLLDVTESYGRLADVGRVIVPVGRNGEKAFEINRLEGQSQEDNYDFKKELEQIATTLVGTPYSLLDINSNTDYATNLLSQDNREVQDSISFQITLEKCYSEFLTKYVSFEKGEEVEIKVTLPTPKGLTNGKENEVIRTIQEKVETVVRMRLGQDASPDLIKHLTSELFRKETSTHLDWRFIENTIDKYNAQNSAESNEDIGGY